MKTTFELHRTDGRPFEDGEGDQILMNAVRRTQYPMHVTGITQENGSVVGKVALIGNHQYYRIQLLLARLKEVPGIRLEYRGSIGD